MNLTLSVLVPLFFGLIVSITGFYGCIGFSVFFALVFLDGLSSGDEVTKSKARKVFLFSWMFYLLLWQIVPLMRSIN